MIFGINTTRDISKLSQITNNSFEISLVVFMPNTTTNHATVPILIIQCQHFRIFIISRTTTNRQKMEVFHLDKQKATLLVGITE